MTVSERIRAIVDALPEGSAVTLPASTLREWLGTDSHSAPIVVPDAVQPTWRERLWTCPGETRLGVRELGEALDRSSDWVYRATNAKLAATHGRDPLPCVRLDGSLVFTATAVRDWLRVSEVVVNPAPRHRRLQRAS